MSPPAFDVCALGETWDRMDAALVAILRDPARCREEAAKGPEHARAIEAGLTWARRRGLLPAQGGAA